MHISGVFFDTEIVYQNLYKRWESFMNTKKVFKDISKLIELLDRKKKSFGLVLKRTFGNNVQPLLSGFKYVAKEYHVKDLGKVHVDL